MSLCLKSSLSATACHQNFVRCNKTLLLHCIIRKVFECIYDCRNFQNTAWQLCISVCTSNDGVDGIDCFQQRKRGSSCCGVCSPTWKDSLQIGQGFFWLIWMVDQYLKCPWCLHGRDFTLADMTKQEYQFHWWDNGIKMHGLLPFYSQKQHQIATTRLGSDLTTSSFICCGKTFAVVTEVAGEKISILRRHLSRVE